MKRLEMKDDKIFIVYIWRFWVETTAGFVLESLTQFNRLSDDTHTR